MIMNTGPRKRRKDGAPYRAHDPSAHWDVSCPAEGCQRVVDNTKLTQHLTSQHPEWYYGGKPSRAPEPEL